MLGCAGIILGHAGMFCIVWDVLEWCLDGAGMLSASQLPTWQLCNLHNSATQLRRWQRVMESSPQALGAAVAAGKAGPKSLAASRAGAPQASQGWLLSLLTSPKRPFGSILCLSEMYFCALCSGPERQKEAWRIGEYLQRLCHVLKKMVKEKAAQGGCLSVCSLKDWGSRVSR